MGRASRAGMCGAVLAAMCLSPDAPGANGGGGGESDKDKSDAKGGDKSGDKGQADLVIKPQAPQAELTEPVLSKTKVTTSRAVHVYRADGWLKKYPASNPERSGCEGRHGVVTMGFGGCGNVTVTPDHANDHEGLNVLHYSSLSVYEPMNAKQRQALIDRGTNVWAEWPPKA